MRTPAAQLVGKRLGLVGERAEIRVGGTDLGRERLGDVGQAAELVGPTPVVSAPVDVASHGSARLARDIPRAGCGLSARSPVMASIPAVTAKLLIGL